MSRDEKTIKARACVRVGVRACVRVYVCVRVFWREILL